MKHPAKFSQSIIDKLDKLCPPGLILDPFAGTGKVHLLTNSKRFTIGVEIEPEWADLHPQTILGNALDLPFYDDMFDAVVTSPVYGNRASDHHDAKDGSVRHTYRHSLGRPLHPDNSGQLQWGNKYKEFHDKAWDECKRVLKQGGTFLLNVSDHIRGGEVMPVAEWHKQCLVDKGFTYLACHDVDTPRLRHGQNHDVRVPSEQIYVFKL